MASSCITYRASILIDAHRWIPDGFLTLEPSSQTIRELGDWASFQGSRQNVIELENRTLLPALVNAHCHLEFSDLEQPFQSSNGTFANWIQQVIAWRLQLSREQTHEQLKASRRQAIQLGLTECGTSGTIGIGDIVTAPFDADLTAGVDSIPESQIPVPQRIHFLECLGLGSDRANLLMEQIEPLVDETFHDRGLSPHAPYSTATFVYQQLASWARQQSVPLATHLAETLEEKELLQNRSGPLVDLFKQMGVWNPSAIEARSFRDVMDSLAGVAHVLLIHGNYLEPEDWQAIPGRNWSVVYCPQTHAHFQHAAHRWPEMWRDGVCVAMGTDSRASSRCLDLWEDFRLAADRHPGHVQQLFQMATQNGAIALGRAKQWGTLEPGKSGKILTCPSTLGRSLQPFWEELPTLTPTWL